MSHSKEARWALSLGALGVVYGDIGTSPLYALKECVSEEHGLTPTPDNVMGILSLVFWAMTLVVTLKYLVFILRADNDGEGGILALLALIPKHLRNGGPGRITVLAVCGIVGAALLYGDGMITPAISVLSAVEGLEIAFPGLESAVVPITVAILVGLFAIQRFGTARIGRLFGPVMLVWFVTIAILGLIQIVANPGILAALSPHYAVQLFAEHGGHAFLLLGSVILVVTGGEALYADMGHFGRDPIRRVWLGLVKPALLLAYFGQGALLLSNPGVRKNPFFGMAEGQAFTIFLVVLATFATIIASQALISGVYSLTQQAVQLGYLPRFAIRHTSADTEGQIYVPAINWIIAIATITLVLSFGESSGLAAAYGIAVAGTMTVTSVLFYFVARHTWNWSRVKASALLGLFLVVDLAFLIANSTKIVSGGWVPLAIGLVIAVGMIAWMVGRSLLADYLRETAREWPAFLDDCSARGIARVPGVAVFLTSDPERAPSFLVRHETDIGVMHEHVLILSLEFMRTPYVRTQRLTVEPIGHGLHKVRARYGFMERPDVPRLVDQAMNEIGLAQARSSVVYFMGRETHLVTNKGRLAGLLEHVFAFMARNALPASLYFQIPPEQVVEMGMQLDL